jgi:hypothetical protein
MMRNFALAGLLGVSLIALSVPAHAEYCDRLRWQCEHKYELGREGEGICRRYREECENRQRSHCERLRWQCEHKYELGREGEGLCHRYREECR